MTLANVADDCPLDILVIYAKCVCIKYFAIFVYIFPIVSNFLDIITITERYYNANEILQCFSYNARNMFIKSVRILSRTCSYVAFCNIVRARMMWNYATDSASMSTSKMKQLLSYMPFVFYHMERRKTQGADISLQFVENQRSRCFIESDDEINEG